MPPSNRVSLAVGCPREAAPPPRDDGARCALLPDGEAARHRGGTGEVRGRALPATDDRGPGREPGITTRTPLSTSSEPTGWFPLPVSTRCPGSKNLRRMGNYVLRSDPMEGHPRCVFGRRPRTGAISSPWGALQRGDFKSHLVAAHSVQRPAGRSDRGIRSRRSRLRPRAFRRTILVSGNKTCASRGCEPPVGWGFCTVREAGTAQAQRGGPTAGGCNEHRV